MAQIDIADLAVLVANIKAVEQARLNCFYRDGQPIKAIEEYVTPDRLADIAAATGIQPTDGLFNENHTVAITKEIVWRGCRFWAAVG